MRLCFAVQTTIVQHTWPFQKTPPPPPERKKRVSCSQMRRTASNKRPKQLIILEAPFTWINHNFLCIMVPQLPNRKGSKLLQSYCPLFAFSTAGPRFEEQSRFAILKDRVRSQNSGMPVKGPLYAACSLRPSTPLTAETLNP